MLYRFHATISSILFVLSAVMGAAAPAGATGIYSEAVLKRDAPRLKRAVSRIYNEGLRPTFTARETAGIGRATFQFPLPRPDDAVLNFYAGYVGGKPTVVLPLQSLKLVEDLTTAFAWLYVTKQPFDPLDLYFAMLQRKPHEDLGRPGQRDILTLLGAPKNVLKNKAVDRLSLSLRNEAFAFIVAHELGHILFKHQGLAGITPAQARADEVESDTFALDVLARSGTPPLGAVLFFQAQIFSLPHRGEHKTQQAWQTYLDTASTHPLSVERIDAMAKMVSGPLADKRTTERGIWVDIGRQLRGVNAILADVELHNCMTQFAARAPVSVLRQANQIAHRVIKQRCHAQ